MGVKLGPRYVVPVPLAIPKQDESTRPGSSGSSSGSSSSSGGSGSTRTYPEYAYCLWTKRAVDFLNPTFASAAFPVDTKANQYKYIQTSQSVGQNHWKIYKEVTVTQNNQQVTKLQGVQVPFGIARVRDIIDFCRKLQGVVRITSPRGRSYYLRSPSSSGGGGGGGN